MRTAQSDSTKQLIEETIRTRHPKTVAELLRIMQNKDPAITAEDVVEVVKKLKNDGKIELDLLPQRVETYLQYLMVKSENIWFYLVMAASVATLATVYIIPNTYPAIVFRWVLGTILVLFLPGYAAIQALFPSGKELDGIERFALSVGLSLAITPLIGLLLNYTPWGIRLDPIMTSLSLFTLAVAAAATYRKYQGASTKQNQT